MKNEKTAREAIKIKDLDSRSEAQLVDMIRSFEMQIKEAQRSMLEDLEKFLGGNQTAGTRARGYLQDIRVLAQSIRVAIQALKNKKK